MLFEYKMDIISSDKVYLIYSLMGSIFFGLICGLISVASSYSFVKYIFRAEK